MISVMFIMYNVMCLGSYILEMLYLLILLLFIFMRQAFTVDHAQCEMLYLNLGM